MKRIFFIVTVCLLALSCGKDKPGNEVVYEDPADEFVGSYTFTDNYKLSWGEDTEETATGTFMITKTGTNGVEVTGAFNTMGLVSVGMLNLVTVAIDNDQMTATMTFGPGTMKGKVLTFSYSVYGRAYKDGFKRPYDKRGNITATKK